VSSQQRLSNACDAKQIGMDTKTLIAWLKDAHAMEMAWASKLCRQAHDARESVGTRVRIERHLRETEQHALRVGQALQGLGSAAPPSHTSTASVLGIAEVLPASFFSGDRIRNAIAEVAAEQLEIASYTALITAAEHVGEQEIARLCRLNRGEHEEMAEWRDAYLSILISEIDGAA
jgi:ferritin-like metal-binding protein YciE